ncbi:MAG: 16S rRNA processing protein RimM [Ruminococcaceae bacterium]|nr:16S rRNA processing protein RimM [Oscillospiraceae bacterium]
MELIETGKIVGTHGIAGDVKVQAWADAPDVLLDFEYVYIDGRRFDIEYAKIHKNNVLYKFYGIDNLNKAELLRNKIIYVERSFFDLEDGEYFIKDLLTLSVFDVDTGVNYGMITDVLKTGANDVYQITDENGVIRMIPAIGDVIIETDIENKIMKIRPLNGLFDEN